MKSAFLTALLLSALPVIAGTPATPITPAPVASPWECRLSIYGWMESLDGDIGIRGETVPIDVPFSEILENLDFTAMGAIEVGRGRWSFVADGIYASLSDSATDGRGGSLKVDLEQFIGNFLVAYELAKTDGYRFDMYAGARVNSMNVDLYLKDGSGGKFSGSGSKTWVDPIIGARFQAALPHNFFFRALGDVGGFDVSSTFTWQALAAIGYNINEHNSVLLGYRAIGTNYSNAGFTYDVDASGIILGYQYTF
ncbi:MAG: hypothetical protein H8M99_11645 [Gloeobacteraceae cyanobacterium ES-bin-144]|nr:hypothetical protein [Verrucomicrobiales bacterium]